MDSNNWESKFEVKRSRSLGTKCEIFCEYLRDVGRSTSNQNHHRLVYISSNCISVTSENASSHTSRTSYVRLLNAVGRSYFKGILPLILVNGEVMAKVWATEHESAKIVLAHYIFVKSRSIYIKRTPKWSLVHSTCIQVAYHQIHFTSGNE